MTEFLPVSSSGHLVLTEAVIGVAIPGVAVEVTLHVGTLFAVLIAYRRRIGEILLGMRHREGGAWRYLGLLVLATIPAGVAGVLFSEWLERAFGSLGVVGVDFLVTGGILWSTRRVRDQAEADAPSVGGAIAIGLAQAVAILPGISRSGSTIAAALWHGVRPQRAAEFSFLMSVPVIAGAAVLQAPHLLAQGTEVGVFPLALSFTTALVAGVAAIKFVVALLSRGGFHRFAPYCWVLGFVTIAWAMARA